MEEDLPQKSLLIIGAGGIGTTVVDLLVPALERIQLGAKITLMDGDTVEASNLGHQNYSAADIGAFKVDALASKWSKANGLQVRSVAENLRDLNNLMDMIWLWSVSTDLNHDASFTLLMCRGLTCVALVMAGWYSLLTPIQT